VAKRGDELRQAAWRLEPSSSIHCPVDVNAIQTVQSIQRIKQISASLQAEIWVLHDPDDWQRLGKVEGGYK
jgi:hypothetical protein